MDESLARQGGAGHRRRAARRRGDRAPAARRWRQRAAALPRLGEPTRRSSRRELNAARAKSAARVKAELLAPIAPRALVSARRSRVSAASTSLVNNASSFFPVAVGADRGFALGRAGGLEPARAAVHLPGSGAGARKTRGLYRQHRRHPRRAPAEGLSASIASPRPGWRRSRASLALELAPARARERRRARRHRLARGRAVRSRRARAASSPPHRSRAWARRKTSRRRSTSSPPRPYVTGQIIAVDGGRSIYI